MIRTYSELSKLNTFQERYAYLKLGGAVGAKTFGYDRWVNQRFYTSTQWKQVRHEVIVRDEGRDMGLEGHDIFGRVLIHHMNPLVLDDIVHGTTNLLDPEYLICVKHSTHNAIHYGDEGLLDREPVQRLPGDTKLW